MTAYFWIIALVVLLVVEAITYNLTTIWFAIACVPLILLAAMGLELAVMPQVLLFAVISAVLLVFTRPLAIKKLKQKKDVNFLIGQQVKVLSDIAGDEIGQVKTHNGVTWNAISESGNVISANSVATITKVQGNTLTVSF